MIDDIISETCDVMIESFLKIKQYFDFKKNLQLFGLFKVLLLKMID